MKTLCVELFILCLFFIGCVTAMAGERTEYKHIGDVPVEKWQELAKKKIYFGHQSVCCIIINGIKQVMKEHPEIQIHIVEGCSFPGDGRAFLRSRVGENTKPETKIDDFVKVVKEELVTTPDVAALKFCYVDVYDKIDVSEFRKEYRQAMEERKRERPKLTIIHFTMPLKTQVISWKTKLKSLLGKDAWEFEENIKRNQFNKLILDEY